MSALTKADMVNHLVIRMRLTRQQARFLVVNFFDEISKSLADGKEVKLSGFGNFELKDKKSRPGRNPKTGEEIPVQARRVVTFKAGQKLRGRIDMENKQH
ncbi:integration host factor subunit alpha [Moraxella caviae]|uniref:Integration host factor subunit alpha n=1 Tax=Moraxella caviae TaxID=34060 RepID=A0A1T0A9B4_9GAMM|nr:integration host factor subunit alpha [Moraxella caviae]OOR91891.1 integration host factor subunit alpha [Moraxella caviae]STZ09743.1 Integration host factor subunit alpha [Moraxella caviae]VEW11218.1 Integration host factor subunit alpha [Moraxella caviae]